MRSTLEIIIAVKESQSVTEEELRMALLVMSAVDYFLGDELQKLVEAIEAGKASASLRASFAKGTIERMFLARKKNPLEWLGPTNIPGNPEYEQRYAMGMRILEVVEKKVEG